MRERRQKGDELTGRRQGYKQLRGEIHFFFRRIWLVVIVIGLTSTVGLAVAGYLLLELKEQARERCENINTRHDNTISVLIAGSNEDQLNAKDSISREEIRRRRDVTIGLIDAVAPKTNCEDPAEVKPLPEVTPIPEE